MKRFYVHVAVENLHQSIQFYSTLFGEPAVIKADYAKWMVEDPRLNFAISERGRGFGVDHLGIQLDTDAELLALRDRMAAGELPLSEQSNASCCYAKSDKWWTMDPQGVAWETYHILGTIPVYGAETVDAAPSLRPRRSRPRQKTAAHERAGLQRAISVHAQFRAQHHGRGHRQQPASGARKAQGIQRWQHTGRRSQSICA